MTVKSGRYVRPHDAVFRIKNYLSQELGKKHRIGIREVRGKRYKIRFELDYKSKREIRIPFVKSIMIDGKNCTLILENINEEFLQKNSILTQKV